MNKLYKRLEAKVDALLEKSGIDLAQFDDTDTKPRAPRELTEAEQQAIDNAPKAPATVPDADMPRVTTQNAPSVASSVPKEGNASKAKGK